MAEIVYHGSRAELGAIFRRLAGMLSGRVPDTYGVADGFNLRLSTALLSQIQQDFLVKSRGGTGRDGIKWAPLSPKTIAYGEADHPRGVGGDGVREADGPTAEPDARAGPAMAGRSSPARSGASGSTVGCPRGKPGPRPRPSRGRRSSAKGRRRSSASSAVVRWTSCGTPAYSSARSRPGVADGPSGEEGQVLRFQPGRLVVGTNVKPWHHAGIPGRLPARPALAGRRDDPRRLVAGRGGRGQAGVRPGGRTDPRAREGSVVHILLQAVEAELKDLFQAVAAFRVGIEPDGRPPPSAGQWYAAVFPKSETNRDHNPVKLDLAHGIGVTVTQKLAVAPRDRQGRQMTIAGSGLIPVAGRIRDRLHGSWSVVNRANALLTAEDYGFAETLVFGGAVYSIKGPDWVWAGEDEDPSVFVAELSFVGARRVVPLGVGS
jgi:hypothetical protein